MNTTGLETNTQKMDRLEAKIERLKAENARLNTELEESRGTTRFVLEECNVEKARLKAENARLAAATELGRVKQTQLDYLRAQLDLHKKELAEVNAENSRLAAGSRLMRIGIESVYSFLQNEGGVTDELEQAMQQRDYVAYLRDMLVPTIEQWEFLSNNFKNGWAHNCESRHDVVLFIEGLARKELARLLGLVERE